MTFWEKKISWGEWFSTLSILLKTQSFYPQHFSSHQKQPLATTLDPKSHTESNVFMFAWDLWWLLLQTDTCWEISYDSEDVKGTSCFSLTPNSPLLSHPCQQKKIVWASRGVSQATSIHLPQLCKLSLLLNKSLCLMPFQWMANCKPGQMETDMKCRFFQKHSI